MTTYDRKKKIIIIIIGSEIVVRIDFDICIFEISSMRVTSRNDFSIFFYFFFSKFVSFVNDVIVVVVD